MNHEPPHSAYFHSLTHQGPQSFSCISVRGEWHTKLRYCFSKLSSSTQMKKYPQPVFVVSAKIFTNFLHLSLKSASSGPSGYRIFFPSRTESQNIYFFHEFELSLLGCILESSWWLHVYHVERGLTVYMMVFQIFPARVTEFSPTLVSHL